MALGAANKQMDKNQFQANAYMFRYEDTNRSLASSSNLVPVSAKRDHNGLSKSCVQSSDMLNNWMKNFYMNTYQVQLLQNLS